MTHQQLFQPSPPLSAKILGRVVSTDQDFPPTFFFKIINISTLLNPMINDQLLSYITY